MVASKTTKPNICIIDLQKTLITLVSMDIVLYLYIYIALLAMHTNQKRVQCERPRAVLRERKEAVGSPANKVDRVEGRSWLCNLCAAN